MIDEFNKKWEEEYKMKTILALVYAVFSDCEPYAVL
jgi:hypothetical protein